MNNLLRKEFGLTIHPMYVGAAFIFGALAMIPQWPYLIIPFYFCWVTVPTLMGRLKTNKDNQFSALLPVPRRTVVAARVTSFSILELLHVIAAGIGSAVHLAVFGPENFALQLGLGYLGVCLVIYGVFNVVLFPMYYRTAEKFGLPLILAIVVSAVVASAAEVLVGVSEPVAAVLENRVAAGVPALLGGVIVFVLLGYVAFRVSAKRYETVQL